MFVVPSVFFKNSSTHTELFFGIPNYNENVINSGVAYKLLEPIFE